MGAEQELRPGGAELWGWEMLGKVGGEKGGRRDAGKERREAAMAPAEGRGSSTGPGTRGALSHVWMGEIQTMAVESIPGPGAGSPGQGVS